MHTYTQYIICFYHSDIQVYTHGENVLVTICIRNNSNKMVKKIKVMMQQIVDIVIFQNGQCRTTLTAAETQWVQNTNVYNTIYATVLWYYVPQRAVGFHNDTCIAQDIMIIFYWQIITVLLVDTNGTYILSIEYIYIYIKYSTSRINSMDTGIISNIIMYSYVY